jgi:hypothetical protein
MFDVIKWWQLRTTSSRPLRFSNRVVLCFENLETRTLLSSGVIQTTIFDGPLATVAIVAEPVNLNATSAQSQQTLSDVVAGGHSSKVLPAQYEQPDPASRMALPDPFGFQMLRQMDRIVTALMNFEMGLLNASMASFSSDASQGLEMPGLNTGTSATGTVAGMNQIRITVPLYQVQPVTDLNTGLNSLQLQVNNPNTGSSTSNSTTTTNTTTGTSSQLFNPGNSNGFVGPEGGSGRSIRAPIQNGGAPAAGGMTSSGQQVVNVPPSGGNVPPSSLSPDLARNTSQGLVSPTFPGVLPGQGTPGGTLVGGQILLPGVVTTPPSPSQQIQAGILNTADPYARFEQTILTKEGFKTASGEEVPIPRPRVNEPNPVRAFGAFEEEQELDLLDPSQVGSEDQAAIRHKADTFFADNALMGQDEGWSHGSSVALAGAMLILGGFWGVQVQKNEERKRRQSVFTKLRQWLRR